MLYMRVVNNLSYIRICYCDIWIATENAKLHIHELHFNIVNSNFKQILLQLYMCLTIINWTSLSWQQMPHFTLCDRSWLCT